jgi:hypothetical protein
MPHGLEAAAAAAACSKNTAAAAARPPWLYSFCRHAAENEKSSSNDRLLAQKLVEFLTKISIF